MSAETYATVRTGIDKFRNRRITLYWVFLMSSLAVVLGSGVLWLRPPSAGPTGTPASYADWQAANSVLHWVEEGLRYATPMFFDGAITYLVIEHPWRLFFVVVYALILYSIRVWLQMAMEDREAKARLALLKLHDRST